MTGEPTHTASEMAPRAPATVYQYIIWKVKYPLCFIVNYVQPVTWHYEPRTVRKVPLQSTHTPKEKIWCCAP